jgi:hypothetical protein
MTAVRRYAFQITLVLLLLVQINCAHRSSDTPITSTARPIVVPVVTRDRVERVTTAVPFPRGLAIHKGVLYVLARGRVREAGGADAHIDDQAGTIFAVDPNLSEPIDHYPASTGVQTNAKIVAAPTQPPFKLLDRTKTPATADRETDRPYCTLRFDALTQNFFICAFSGIDKPQGGASVFSKNVNDGVLRYDTRTQKWYDVERHNIEAGGNYPHHDVASHAPPHGWLNGPDNCLVVGWWLYAVSKENSLLVRYDLSDIQKNPEAPAPSGEVVLNHKLLIHENNSHTLREFYGPSMLAWRDGFLYIGYRTSSVIVRVPMTPDGDISKPVIGQTVGLFDAYDSATQKGANLTDMCFGPEGDLYVISAQPSRVYRFTPDNKNVFDGRTKKSTEKSNVWADLAMLTNNPKMKSENIFVDNNGHVYVTSGDAYGNTPTGGTVYRIRNQPVLSY